MNQRRKEKEKQKENKVERVSVCVRVSVFVSACESERELGCMRTEREGVFVIVCVRVEVKRNGI